MQEKPAGRPVIAGEDSQVAVVVEPEIEERSQIGVEVGQEEESTMVLLEETYIAHLPVPGVPHMYLAQVKAEPR